MLDRTRLQKYEIDDGGGSEKKKKMIQLKMFDKGTERLNTI
jgi:hypothetical protein